MRRVPATAALTAALLLSACFLSACAGSPEPEVRGVEAVADARGYLALPDRVSYLQTDPRWAGERMGPAGDTLGSDGCLVTAVAMAVGNLGVSADPEELNRRLSEADGFTRRGWLKWGAIGPATDGAARATYHDDVSPSLIRQCMAAGEYPLVRFILPNGRSHWAMIVAESPEGYRMRDPLRESRRPLIFPRGAEAFKSLRCVGAAEGRA